VNDRRTRPILVPLPDWQQSAVQIARLQMRPVSGGNVFQAIVEEANRICALSDPSFSPRGKNFVMWQGYEWHLSSYVMMILGESNRHDPPRTAFERMWFHEQLKIAQQNFTEAEKTNEPWWFGEGFFHESHQAWLKREFHQDYKHHFPKTPQSLPLVWPPHEPHRRRVL
jgi:hypothetical protein